MTVVADNKKRVTIRHAKPGDCFEVEVAGEGRFILTKLQPAPPTQPAKVRIKKRDGYSVGVLDHPISEAAIKQAVSEFP
jgi:phage FluMu protein gp41